VAPWCRGFEGSLPDNLIEPISTTEGQDGTRSRAPSLRSHQLPTLPDPLDTEEVGWFRHVDRSVPRHRRAGRRGADGTRRRETGQGGAGRRGWGRRGLGGPNCQPASQGHGPVKVRCHGGSSGTGRSQASSGKRKQGREGRGTAILRPGHARPTERRARASCGAGSERELSEACCFDC
jgi:hypothetical protein